MRISLAGILVWVVAFAAVFAFYAHTLFNQPTEVTTPIVAAAIAACLVALAVLDFTSITFAPPVSNPRRVATMMLWGALALFGASTMIGLFERGMDLRDWGLAAVEIGTPVLLFFSSRRFQILDAIARVCVVFAILDMLANFLAVLGLISLDVYSGRIDQFGTRIRYPGLTENTLASGLVCFIAISYLAWRLANHRLQSRFIRLCVIAPAIALLFLSLDLIDARRYMLMALAVVALLLVDKRQRLPPILIAAAIAAIFLAATEMADYGDLGNRLRGTLMAEGAARAVTHPIFGEGVFHRGAETGGYEVLSQAGVTESGVLDMAIAYGMPATVLFVACCLLTLNARRRGQTWASAVLAVMTGGLAVQDEVSSFLGALLFYGVLLHCQRDEWQVAYSKPVDLANNPSSA